MTYLKCHALPKCASFKVDGQVEVLISRSLGETSFLLTHLHCFQQLYAQLLARVMQACRTIASAVWINLALHPQVALSCLAAAVTILNVQA